MKIGCHIAHRDELVHVVYSNSYEKLDIYVDQNTSIEKILTMAECKYLFGRTVIRLDDKYIKHFDTTLRQYDVHNGQVCFLLVMNKYINA